LRRERIIQPNQRERERRRLQRDDCHVQWKWLTTDHDPPNNESHFWCKSADAFQQIICSGSLDANPSSDADAEIGTAPGWQFQTLILTNGSISAQEDGDWCGGTQHQD
jgi:hypothetical protein